MLLLYLADAGMACLTSVAIAGGGEQDQDVVIEMLGRVRDSRGVTFGLRAVPRNSRVGSNN